MLHPTCPMYNGARSCIKKKWINNWLLLYLNQIFSYFLVFHIFSVLIRITLSKKSSRNFNNENIPMRFQFFFPQSVVCSEIPHSSQCCMYVTAAAAGMRKCLLILFQFWIMLCSDMTWNEFSVWHLTLHTTYSWNIKWQKCAGMGLNGFIFKKINAN